MKRSITTLVVALAALFIVTASPRALRAAETPRIEAVFVLDTTGSMSGLISAAKEKIWAIANSLAQAEPTPEIKVGLVAYRDRGDDYVTKRTDLTHDLDAVYNDLMAYEASGGGDGPESVNQALNEAVTQTSWSRDDDTYRVIFLVGDFPPHLDYDDDVPYAASCKDAAERGIVVNTIQCGNHSPTTPIWREIALLSDGDFFQVEQSGGAVIASTPFDDELAELSRRLDGTRLYYGDRAARAEAKERGKLARAIHGKASKAANARRAEFNASAAGLDNFAGKQELLSDLARGKVKLAAIAEDELPEELRKLDADDRVALVRQKQAERDKLKGKIEKLAKQRRGHIEKQLAATADQGKGALGQRIYDSVRSQAKRKAITFESDLAAH